MMTLHHRGGKRLQRKPERQGKLQIRLASLLLCLSMLAGFLPALASEGKDREKFSTIVKRFDSITLYYVGDGGQTTGKTVPNEALIKPEDQLILRYEYTITDEECKGITAGTEYYLEISPHLVLPHLESGEPLNIEVEDGSTKKFGMLYADGKSAWVTFLPSETAPTGTVLTDFGGIENAYFYLNCGRAADVPADENPIEGRNNLYAMKFENGEQITFGYAENEPVTAKAQINKGGSLTDKTITWKIDYTPWQNPSPDDGVTLNTPFELRDTIDTSLHSYVDNSVTIGGQTVTAYTSRNEIQGGEAAYVIVETPADGGNTTLTFGGTKFNAGQATQGKPAKPLAITYQTSIKDELLLPGSSGNQKVTNAAELFAGKDGVFNSLNISSSSTVPIPQPKWLEKTGTTDRHTDGTGSTTTWTVKFSPNGFTGLNELTLHDHLPTGSTLDVNSVKVGGTPKAAAVDNANNSFTVSEITAGGQDVVITYQTHVEEDMYENGTNLGSNTAWFTFQYSGETYTTPQAQKDVGSGDGTGTPGTAILVKTNEGYNAANRTIKWTVKINPHKANLKSGTFIDDLSTLGPACNVSGHTRGLEVMGGKDGIMVSVGNSTPADDSQVKVTYSNQKIIVETNNVGAQTITLTYTTKVCDPCVFANNTTNAQFKNTISTNNMLIGSSTTGRSASADSTANVSASVLKKNPPVYDYKTGIMTWTVEVDAAGLSMTDVVLTDELPDGLTYKENSFKTVPEISSASASVSGQTLSINLGAVTGKTTVTFDTKVDPEILGFGGDQPVVVNNTIRMNGRADGVEFAEVSHSVEQSFSNHGLVKSSSVNNLQEFIQYEVLINPFGLALPKNPSLVDTLDKRLQLDTDTLKFYKAALSGTTSASGQKPSYTKTGDGQTLKVSDFDPDTNSFTVELPIGKDSRDAYVLTYTADIIQREAGGYGNSVRFDGGSVLLGGSKNNSASVGGGGGGGGGGVAARKSTISVVKTDSETKDPLPGVSFTLYQWNSDNGTRGLPFAQGETDAQGKLSFLVKPGAFYELVETGNAPGYDSTLGWTELPDGVTETNGGLLIQAGAAKSTLTLNLTNKAYTTDIVFRLVNEEGIPMTGEPVQLFSEDPSGIENPVPVAEVTVEEDGTVKFPDIRRGEVYFIPSPGGGIMTIEVPAQPDDPPKVKLPDDTAEDLTPDYSVQGVTPEEKQWTLTVKKVISGSETPLAGAAIGLYADEACQALIKTAVSDENGTILFSGLIKGQRYWLKETAAPSNYHLNSTIYEADEASAAVTIENTPQNPPVDPEQPTESDTPDEPGAPGDPDRPGRPDWPDGPAYPDEPDRPGRPNRPDIPGKPGEPDASGKPDQPGIPDIPGEPNAPGEADQPGIPDIPGEPGAPGEAGQPGIQDVTTPEAPDTPGDPVIPDGSSAPAGFDGGSASAAPGASDLQSGEDFSGTSDVPKTGDHTLWMIVIAALSGIMLAIMVLNQFWTWKKRSKK